MCPSMEAYWFTRWARPLDGEFPVAPVPPSTQQQVADRHPTNGSKSEFRCSVIQGLASGTPVMGGVKHLKDVWFLPGSPQG